MAELAISEFHEGMRIALGDEGVAGSWDFDDDRLSAAIRTTVRAGFVPCVRVKEGDNTKLDPAPPNADTWGYLLLKACFMLRGGETPRSVTTRSMSVNVQPIARRDSLTALETLISNLEEKGNLCGKASDTSDKTLFVAVHDFMTHVYTICEVEDPPVYGPPNTAQSIPFLT